MSTALHMCHGRPSGSLVSSPRETSSNLPECRQDTSSFRSLRCKFGGPLAHATTRSNTSRKHDPFTLFHAFSQLVTRIFTGQYTQKSPCFTLFHPFSRKIISFRKRPDLPSPSIATAAWPQSIVDNTPLGHALATIRLWPKQPLSTLCPR